MKEVPFFDGLLPIISLYVEAQVCLLKDNLPAIEKFCILSEQRRNEISQEMPISKSYLYGSSIIIFV
jgi:hypothetical protein